LIPPQSLHAIPDYARAVMEALQFSGASTGSLSKLDDRDWDKLLAFSDRSSLSLPLGLQYPHPALEARLADNAQRWERTKAAYAEIAQRYEEAGIDFVVLKGFSHCPAFIADPRRRAQYDLDLFLPEEQIRNALNIARAIGYELIVTMDRLPVDHLPTMVRKTGWEWRGNYFDPDLPLSLELHFRLWDDGNEKIEIEGLEAFWERRERRCVDGLHFTGFSKMDAVAYASLHLLRHLLRGDLRPAHLYELASFHENTAEDAALWRSWGAVHKDSLKRVQAISAELARAWFSCRLSETVQEEVTKLPPPVRRWLVEYAFSPLASLFRPNKDELWLHLSLLESTGAKAAVLRRRLLPISWPGAFGATHVPAADLTVAVRLRSALRYGAFLLRRLTHHSRAFPVVLVEAVRWYLPGFGLSPAYWRFFAAAGLYDFGLFVYFLLYNLYLLQLGFGEKFLGFVSSSMLAGSIAGSIPAGLAIQRFGLRNVLLGGFLTLAVLSAVRASVTGTVALIVLAAIAGFVSSFWAVGISPCVAQLSTPKNRALGFSLIFSSGIGIGVFGGVVGGRLPGWFARFGSKPPGPFAYRASLLLGCAIVLLGAWPLRRLDLAGGEGRARMRLPGPALSRYLLAAAVWNLGTGAFNPFFTAYLARLRTGVETIGLIFSMAQLAQVAAVLLAPLVLRKLGLVKGISWMQGLTGVALLLLAGAAGPAFAAVAYATFMVFQYMSEPGLYTLLMDSVREEERSEASALNFLVASSAQALAAAVSGAVIEKAGYATMLIAAAFVCMIAGLLFRKLLSSLCLKSFPI
jgi:MFS family permease